MLLTAVLSFASLPVGFDGCSTSLHTILYDHPLHCRYRPHLPVSFIESELGFTAADEPESECRKFLQDLGVVFTDDGTKVDCKQSQSALGAS